MFDPVELIRRRIERIRGWFSAGTDARELLLEATDREAFREALADGDVERAALHHPRSAAEIERRMDEIVQAGTGRDVKFPTERDAANDGSGDDQSGDDRSAGDDPGSGDDQSAGSGQSAGGDES